MPFWKNNHSFWPGWITTTPQQQDDFVIPLWVWAVAIAIVVIVAIIWTLREEEQRRAPQYPGKSAPPSQPDAGLAMKPPPVTEAEEEPSSPSTIQATGDGEESTGAEATEAESPAQPTGEALEAAGGLEKSPPPAAEADEEISGQSTIQATGDGEETEEAESVEAVESAAEPADEALEATSGLEKSPAPVAEAEDEIADQSTIQATGGGEAAGEEEASPPPPPKKPDNLKKVKGIGPKTEKILNEKGITTFEQLAQTEVSRLQAILDEVNYTLAKPDTWPEQARTLAQKQKK